MPDYDYSTAIQEQTRSASSKFDAAYWRSVCLDKRFPEEYWSSLAEGGFFGILIDGERTGYQEGKFVDFCMAVQETAERYAGLGSYLFLSGALVSTIFSRLGSEDQKADLLPKLAAGKVKISIALTEEESGQDASAIQTRATRTNGGGYVINGAKSFVNNADKADYLLLFARTSEPVSEHKKSLGTTMFLVPAKDKRVRAQKLDKLGFDFLNNFNLEFSGVEVEPSSVVGKIGDAWHGVVPVFNMDRVATAASLVGTGKLALRTAADWAKKRELFGRPIGKNQGVQFPLADAYAMLEAAENMTLKAASLCDSDKPFSNEASYALLCASSAASAATDRALQALGGHGYYANYDVERYWRDVRAHRVHPVSEELLLAGVAERSLGLPRSY